ncbi:hypothetical protein [Paenibacillus sp. FSL H7-0326]|uniref:hypothetical protein n=1 Tax=Paenibacillus sp. FSL H7-0326 TaxID=1921144 RepID=UPI00117D6E24|nr:hypothetical protein [Paenibacillus sp. FSL H7-0326]
MITTIRIKASDALEDRFALAFVGGKVREGKHPKFEFTSEQQRREYENLSKKLKGVGFNAEGAEKGDPDARKVRRRNRP